MNDIRRIPIQQIGPEPLADQLDALLADIAIRVQLPPGLFKITCERKAAVQAFLERAASPLPWPIMRFYPQGSMAIDATISTRGTDDEYDLDLVIELFVDEGIPPALVLDMLYKALIDYRVAKVSRQTRCVTLHYADGMHLDITPARRIPYTQDLASKIFHAKSEEPPARHFEVNMNAFAFAEWFKEKTPLEIRFAKAYRQRSFDTFGMLAEDEAINHDVPDQAPLDRKSVTTVALQLIKRFRNIWSSDRGERYPPSVMLSCHAGHAATPGMSLAAMVIRQARWTANAINAAEAAGQKVDVRNPRMTEDRFTDRWPENYKQQRDFAAALIHLAEGLEHIQRNGLELEDAQVWFRNCFGPSVVSRSVEAMVERNGRALRSTAQGYSRSGGLLVPAAPAIIGVDSHTSSLVTPRPHTNMGERR